MDVSRMMKARQRIAEETDPVKVEMLERQLSEDMMREEDIAEVRLVRRSGWLLRGTGWFMVACGLASLLLFATLEEGSMPSVLLAVIFIGSGGLLVWLARRLRVQSEALFQEGIPATAKVVSIDLGGPAMKLTGSRVGARVIIPQFVFDVEVGGRSAYRVLYAKVIPSRIVQRLLGGELREGMGLEAFVKRGSPREIAIRWDGPWKKAGR